MRSLAIASLLLLVAATSPKARTAYDTNVDFESYKTYAWAFTATPRGMDSATFQRIRSAIDQSLSSRGFTQSPAGEFAVAFTLGPRDEADTSVLGPYASHYPEWGWGQHTGWVPEYREYTAMKFKAGTLAIDLYDANSKHPVWHGVTNENIQPGNVGFVSADRAVKAIMANFPPPAESCSQHPAEERITPCRRPHR